MCALSANPRTGIRNERTGSFEVKQTNTLCNNSDGSLEQLCSRCLEWWPADTEFFYLSRGKLESQCKACRIERHRELHPLRRPQPDIFVERNKQIIAMRNTGHTYQAIADCFTITRQRVQQIVAKYSVNRYELQKGAPLW